MGITTVSCNIFDTKCDATSFGKNFAMISEKLLLRSPESVENTERQSTLRFGPPRKRKVLCSSVFSTDSGLLKRSLALKHAFFAPKLVASKKVPRKMIQRQQFPPQIERCKIFAKARGAKRGRATPPSLRWPERQTRGPGSRAPEGQRVGGSPSGIAGVPLWKHDF